MLLFVINTTNAAAIIKNADGSGAGVASCISPRDDVLDDELDDVLERLNAIRVYMNTLALSVADKIIVFFISVSPLYIIFAFCAYGAAPPNLPRFFWVSNMLSLKSSSFTIRDNTGVALSGIGSGIGSVLRRLRVIYPPPHLAL